MADWNLHALEMADTNPTAELLNAPSQEEYERILAKGIDVAARLDKDAVKGGLKRNVTNHLENLLQDMTFNELQFLHEGACCRMIKPPVDRETGFCSQCWDPPTECRCRPEKQFGWWVKKYDWEEQRQFVQWSPEKSLPGLQDEGWYSCFMELSYQLEKTIDDAFAVGVG